MPTARLDKVSLSFGLKPLLDNVALQIRKGERVCLLGRNGEGKSSLLRLIAGTIVPDSGEVWVRPGAKVASLAQEVSPSSDESVLDVVMGGTSAGGVDGDWQAALQVEDAVVEDDLDVFGEEPRFGIKEDGVAIVVADQAGQGGGYGGAAVEGHADQGARAAASAQGGHAFGQEAVKLERDLLRRRGRHRLRTRSR